MRGWEAHSNALFVSQVRQGDRDKPQCAWLDPEMTLRGFVKYCMPFLRKRNTVLGNVQNSPSKTAALGV